MTVSKSIVRRGELGTDAFADHSIIRNNVGTRLKKCFPVEQIKNTWQRGKPGTQNELRKLVQLLKTSLRSVLAETEAVLSIACRVRWILWDQCKNVVFLKESCNSQTKHRLF